MFHSFLHTASLTAHMFLFYLPTQLTHTPPDTKAVLVWGHPGGTWAPHVSTSTKHMFWYSSYIVLVLGVGFNECMLLSVLEY